VTAIKAKFAAKSTQTFAIVVGFFYATVMPLLPVRDALSQVLANCTPQPEVLVPVSQAHHLVLTRELRARRTLPPGDNSAMDGFAVRCQDTVTPGQVLAVRGQAFAGATAQQLEAGTCVKIATGGLVPQGADAIVPVEDTEVVDENHVRIGVVPKAGAFVRRRGEDVKEGQVLLSSGARVTVAAAGMLWAQGIGQVPVHRRPSVAIATSGDELTSFEEQQSQHSVADGLPSQKLIDTNAPMLSLAAAACGAVPTVLGLVSDNLQSLTAHYRRGLEHDVLLTVAGASVGERDFTVKALQALGADFVFAKVAMKPGKPLLFAKIGRTLIFGLPGNPVSALVTFHLFVRPALLAMQGISPQWNTVIAQLDQPLSPALGLHHFIRARLNEAPTFGERPIATPLPNQSSGALNSLVGATHLLSIAPGTLTPAGAMVEAVSLSTDLP
jgi:molybdopterin molybdotransferase